jgi:hypothetical protein
MRKLPAPLPIRGAPGVMSFESIRQAPAGSMYAFEHLLFDTVTYPLAGAANLVLPAFGNNTNARAADATLTNWPASGQLPRPHKFHGLALFVTPQTETSMSGAVDAAGRIRDIDRVLNTARGVLDFDVSATGRRRPPIPLRSIPSLPGVRGVIIPGTAAAQNPIQSYSQTGSGEGYPFDLPIDEGETFTLTLRFGPAAVAISADLLLQIGIYGWYYQQAG